MPLSTVLGRNPALNLATGAFRLLTSLIQIECQMTGGRVHFSAFQAFISLLVKRTQPRESDHNKQGAQSAKSSCAASRSSLKRGTLCCMSMQLSAYRAHESHLQFAQIVSSTSGVYFVLAALVPHAGALCVHKDSSGHASTLCLLWRHVSQ